MHWKYLFNAWLLSSNHVSGLVCQRGYGSRSNNCILSLDRVRYVVARRQTLTATFLSLGFFNTLGRFAGGPISMIPGLSALRVHNILLFTAGVLTVIAAYAYNFTTAALYAGFCGFAIGIPVDMNFVAHE